MPGAEYALFGSFGSFGYRPNAYTLPSSAPK
jgi:hypothetical protein